MKKYEIVMGTNAMCPKRAEITEAIRNAAEKGEKLSAKVVISPEKNVMGQFPVCLDIVKDENQIAIVKEVTDGGAKLSDDDIAILANSEYTCEFSEVSEDGKTMKATLTLTKEKKVLEKNAKCPESVATLAAEKVKEGIITKEEADKKIAVMVKNYVDEQLMLDVVKGWRLYNKPVHGLRCEYVDPYLSDKRKAGKQGVIADGLRNAVNRYPVIMEGEKSVGKNVFVETIAWLMNMPLFLLTFSRNMSPSSVYGEKSTDNSAAEYFKTESAKYAAEARQKLSEAEKALEEVKKTYISTVKCNVNESDISYLTELAKLTDECVGNGDFTPLLIEGGKVEVARRLGKLEDNQELRNAAESLELKIKDMKERVAALELKSAQAQSVNIIIDQSELYDWLESGGLMVFNEMNMAEPNFFASFTNQLCDGTGFLFIPGRGEVPIHKDCVLCGTQNADYEGVEQQNEATMSRFGCISFEQPKTIAPQLEVAVTTELKAKGYTQVLDKADVKTVEKFYIQCRKAVGKGDFTNAVLNIRGFVRALTVKTASNGNLSLADAVEMHVINTCPVDERQPLKSTASTVFGGF